MSARGGKFYRPGKFFNPNAGDDDDDDDDEDESSDEDVEEDEPPSKKRSAANANLSSDDDDDDDEEEDEEEEEEDTRKKKGKPSGKKPKVASFFDEEAEVDDDEGEDDEEPYGTHHDPDDVVRRHYTEEDIRKEQMDEEAQELIRQQDRRRAQARWGQDNERSLADMAAEIEDRHRASRRPVDRMSYDRGVSHQQQPHHHELHHHHHHEEDDDAPGGPEVLTAVTQQSLVPSVSDPSLWMVSCSTGKEQEMVFQIMNKCVAYARQRRPLGICGVIAAQTKGRIYIESYGEPAVVEAIQGVRGLLQYTMKLIPIQDMTTVMTVQPTKKPVKVNEWVRMTRGHYKGDLALVIFVRESGLKCVVQVVPRLDFAVYEMDANEARIRKKTVRPPQKFFNPQDVANMRGVTYNRQRFPVMDLGCDYFDGSYYHEGYLLKEVTVGSMVKPCTDENPPTLDELQRFTKRPKDGTAGNDDGDDNAGAKVAASLIDELLEIQQRTGLAKPAQAGGGLLVGDTVEVIEGDLVGMRGKLMSMDDNTVKIKPNDTGIDIGGTGEIEFLASQVIKHIDVSAHVKVTDGRYANETGTVVAVERMEGENDSTAIVLTDITNKQIKVRTSQLRETAEVSNVQERLDGYTLYDLVLLSGGGSTNENGVIVRVGREDFTVINNHGIARDVRPEELRGKRNQTSNRAVALDVQGNQIRCGDQVNVAEGPHKGKTATIKRMSRSQLFLFAQTRPEHAGIFVVRSRSCVLAGSRQQRGNSAQDGAASPFSTPQSQSGRGGPAARGKRDDALIGKTVRIQAGQWKGNLGIVTDATATHVQVELHSRLKKVMVVRERVAVAGDKFGATEDVNQNDQNNLNGASAGVFAGGATPMHGGATPMHGGATPMHDSMGGGDEVWRPGALDQDASSPTENGGDVWGADSSEPSSFSATNDANDGWGSSNQDGGTWAPTTEKIEPTDDAGGAAASSSNNIAVKHEPQASAAATMETHIDDGGETAVWFMERVCVQLKSDSRTAVIKEINADKTATVEVEGGSTETVRADDVSRIEPKEKDQVLVIGGADVGVEGELVCIDGSDAILKDPNEDFKIVDFVHLAKIASES